MPVIILILIQVVFISTLSAADKITPFEKTSFHEVTSELDTGGRYFYYCSSKEFQKKVDATFQVLKKLTDSTIETPKTKQSIIKVLDIINTIVSASGITEVSGVGMSSIALKSEYYRNRTFIHHFPGDKKGILWKLFSNHPDTLKQLEYIPEDAVFAAVSDINFTEIRKWIKLQKQNITDKNGEKALDLNNDLKIVKSIAKTIEKEQAKADLELGKFNSELFFNSIDGRVLFFATCNFKKLSPVIIKKTPLNLPAPAFLIALPTQDKAAFYEIEKIFPQSHQSPKKDLLKLTFDIKKSPFAYNPVIEQTEKYLLIASNSTILNTFKELQKGIGKSLLQSAKFKEVSLNMPTEVSSITYVSPDFMPNTYKTIQSNIQSIINNGEIKDKKTIKKIETVADSAMELIDILTSLKKNYFLYSVIQNRADGIMITTNSALPIDSSFEKINPSTWLPGSYALLPIYGFFDDDKDETKAIVNAKEIQKINKSNMLQIKQALNRYALNHSGRYPTEQGISGFKVLIKEQYITDVNILQCPTVGKEKIPIQFPLEEQMCDYIYIGGTTDKMSGHIPLVFNKPGRTNEVRVLFLDGSVKKLNKKIMTCRQMIRILHKLLHYSDKTYQTLDTIAARYDKVLGK